MGMVDSKVEVEDAKGMKIGATFKSRIVLPHLPERLELIADNLRGICPARMLRRYTRFGQCRSAMEDVAP